MGKYFGTDGIRGTFGGPLINCDFARRLGFAVAQFLNSGRTVDRPLAAYIGRDTRASGKALLLAFAEGLALQGVHVCDLGILPTPAVALTTSEQAADLGVAITASHNPASDNGIKLFGRGGVKLTEKEEAHIERLLEEQGELPELDTLPHFHSHDGAAHYINFGRALLDEGCLQGWKIVLDLANGATAQTTPAIFERWGAQLVLLGDQPDGQNINDRVGSEHTDQLCRAVRRHKAHLGIAHDGDGDRVVIVDEKGKVVNGDALLGLFAVFAKKADLLAADTFVTTVQTNLGVDQSVEAVGGRGARVPVGDRNVLHKMRELGANLGGESSGHIIFSDFSPTGDGLIAAVKFISLMLATERTASSLAGMIDLFPQRERSLVVAEKIPFKRLRSLPAAINKAERSLKHGGRVLVRYSGTEPKLRFLVEAPEATVASKLLSELVEAASQELEVIES